MIVDCVAYNGEAELFDLRYNILKDYVDEFIVFESNETFSGKPKPLYFEQIRDRYPDVTYVVNERGYTLREYELAKRSPNTKGALHWTLEFIQKERIKYALKHLNDDDIVFIGDCDEIWEPNQLYPEIGKLKLRVYTYYLNNRSSEEFWGTLVCKYKYIKELPEYKGVESIMNAEGMFPCLNHLRSNPPLKSETYMGWHFTSMAHQLRRKLTDSYTEESYATPEVLAKLDENVYTRRDFLGRDFTFSKDESQWPQFLKDNKNNYKHLLYAPH